MPEEKQVVAEVAKQVYEELEFEFRTHLTRDIRPIRNWCEWLARWNAAETLQEIIGLLHCGFTIRMDWMTHEEKRYDDIDRLKFYFSIANGWSDEGLLWTPTDRHDRKYFVGHDSNRNNIEKSQSGLWQMVAQKAFEMLCLNVFNSDPKKDHVLDTIVSERLFPSVQTLFRVVKRGTREEMEMPNKPIYFDSMPHTWEMATKFLFNLAKFLWEWKEPRDAHYYCGDDADKRKEEADKCLVAMRARIDAAKPWMIEVLCYLGKSKILREWLLVLDDACVAKLKEIALRSELSQHRDYVSKDRPVQTLDEACFRGSKAAWLLKERELKLREGKRLGIILQAEREIDQAQRKLQELQGKKK